MKVKKRPRLSIGSAHLSFDGFEVEDLDDIVQLVDTAEHAPEIQVDQLMLKFGFLEQPGVCIYASRAVLRRLLDEASALLEERER